MAQAVSRCCLATKSQVRSWVRSCGIFGGESGIGTGFSASISVLGSIHIIWHGKMRHDTKRQNILSCFSHAGIHISPSPTANDKDSVAGFERREYFACLLTNGRCECTLVFVVSCRVVSCSIM
jgi:hypothetical protein